MDQDAESQKLAVWYTVLAVMVGTIVVVTVLLLLMLLLMLLMLLMLLLMLLMLLLMLLLPAVFAGALILYFLNRSYLKLACMENRSVSES